MWTSMDSQYWNQINMFFAAEEKLYTVIENKTADLTMAQIMNSLLQNSGLNWRK